VTGARRSEILRLRWQDFDFNSETVLLHENKKARGKRTTRRVVLAPPLKARLLRWQEENKNKLVLFPPMKDFQLDSATGSFTQNEANMLFKRSFYRTKWRHIRGWHMFRHSFISNCAAMGVLVQPDLELSGAVGGDDGWCGIDSPFTVAPDSPGVAGFVRSACRASRRRSRASSCLRSRLWWMASRRPARTSCGAT
jgi:Phage integrase family